MGWIDEDLTGHEGYVRGYNFLGTEMRYPNACSTPVKQIVAACECGWRSPRENAPAGSRWSPYIVILGDGDDGPTDERMRQLWRAHAAEVRAEKRARATRDRVWRLSRTIITSVSAASGRVLSQAEAEAAAYAVLEPTSEEP